MCHVAERGDQQPERDDAHAGDAPPPDAQFPRDPVADTPSPAGHSAGVQPPGEPASDERVSDNPAEGPVPGELLSPGPQQPIDAEQLRQFQQFQQFQEFLRFQEAHGGRPDATQQAGGMVPAQPLQPAPRIYENQPQPQQNQSVAPPAPPPGELEPRQRPRIKAPRWLKKLGGKVLSAVIFFVLLGIGVTMAYNHFFGTADEEDRPAAETGGGTYRTNQILSVNPYEAVRAVYDAVAQNLVPQACGRFAEAQQQEFAQNLEFPDCEQAVRALNVDVTDVNTYAESVPSYTSDPIKGEIITIDSCQFPIEGGPALGEFTLTKVEKGQWLITGHRAGPRECPSGPGASSPPSGN